MQKEHNLSKNNREETKKFNLILNLLAQNKILKESKDIILPRLMSGEVNIKKIKI